MLSTARRAREQLTEQRDGLNHRIAGLEKTIEGLQALCGPIPKKPPAVAEVAKAMVQRAGLTDVVRMALQASDDRLTLTQIITVLESINYPLGRLQNPRASIVVILSRLVPSEVERIVEPNTIEPSFRWIARPDPSATTFSVGELMRGKFPAPGLTPPLTLEQLKRIGIGIREKDKK